MPRLVTTGPPADGGYPLDRDLHQMSDDGGPVGPDPSRWADPVWRDHPLGPEAFVGRTPEQVADEVVVSNRGGVELRTAGLPPVQVGRHPNAGVVKERAGHIRRFLTAVIRADRAAR